MSTSCHKEFNIKAKNKICKMTTAVKCHLSVDMPLKYIQDVAASAGLPKYGLKTDIIKRYEMAFDKDKKKSLMKPSVPQLRGIAMEYKVKGSCRTKQQFLTALEKVYVHRECRSLLCNWKYVTPFIPFQNCIDWNFLPEPTPLKELQHAIEHSQSPDFVPDAHKLFICGLCDSRFTTSKTLTFHMSGGHIDKRSKLVIKRASVSSENFLITPYNESTDGRQLFYQLVFIPWYGYDGMAEKVLKNVSVGITTYENVQVYAKACWDGIRSALNNRKVYLASCGSARASTHNLNWFMEPAEAITPQIYMLSPVVGSKVKGFVRKLIGAVHIFSASDEFDFLGDAKAHILDQLERSLGYLADINEWFFDENTLNLKRETSDPKLQQVFMYDPNRVLTDYDSIL